MAKKEKTSGPFWTKNWIESMWRFTSERFVDFDTGTVDFEALGREEYEFRKALFYRNFKNSERAREALEEVNDAYTTHVESGKKGGRPRKETINGDASHREAPDESATVSSNSRAARAIPLPSWDEFNDFITAQGLDYTDAREWWEMTIVARDGKDRYGKPIANWKAACRRFCAAKNQRRNA